MKCLKISKILFLIIVSTSRAEDIDQIRRFAYNLMDSQEYYRAITEFQRINSYYPENIFFKNNLNMIANCYLISDHYLEAISTYNIILQKYPNDGKSIIQIAKLYQKINYFRESIDHINKYNHIQSNHFQDTLKIIQSINYINLNKIECAVKILNQVSDESPANNNSLLFNSIISSQTPLKLKDKSVGIILSALFPGAGYVYTKNYQTGISAFITNIIFGYATYSSFNDNNKTLGVAFSLISIGLYSSSIYGSIQSVQKYNYNVKSQFSQQFKFE